MASNELSFKDIPEFIELLENAEMEINTLKKEIEELKKENKQLKQCNKNLVAEIEYLEEK